jgi:hypothetical protein
MVWMLKLDKVNLYFHNKRILQEMIRVNLKNEIVEISIPRQSRGLYPA